MGLSDSRQQGGPCGTGVPARLQNLCWDPTPPRSTNHLLTTFDHRGTLETETNGRIPVFRKKFWESNLAKRYSLVGVFLFSRLLNVNVLYQGDLICLLRELFVLL